MSYGIWILWARFGWTGNDSRLAKEFQGMLNIPSSIAAFSKDFFAHIFYNQHNVLYASHS